MSETEVNGTKLAKGGLDLLAFGREVKKAQDEGRMIDIINPKTGDRLGVKWYMAGPDSDRYRAARNRVRAERKARASAKPNTPEEDDEEVVRILAAATIKVECDEGVHFGGKVPTNEKEYAAVLRLPGLGFIVEQVDRDGGNRVNFMND
jgi:hypothetical protein